MICDDELLFLLLWLLSLAALSFGMDDRLVLHPTDREKLSKHVDRAADQADDQCVESLFEDDGVDARDGGGRIRRPVPA